MASRLRPFLFFLAVALAATNLASVGNVAAASGLDKKGEAEAKEATRLYKDGQYEGAAKLFGKLASDHPDMPIFERSLGACFYYLHRPEPALSNLRNYLLHRKDVPADDKAVVDRWIEEMEKLAAERAPATPVAATAPAGVSSDLPPTLAPAEEQAKPAGVDLSAQPVERANEARPIYKSWWMWTGAAVVVAAGVVATILLVNRSPNPCDGVAFTCRGVN